MVSIHFQTATLNVVVGSDSAPARAFVDAFIRPDYLAAGSGRPTAEELAGLQSQLAALTRGSEILRVELRLPDGRILAASDPSLAGQVMPVEGAFGDAVGGRPQAGIVPVESAGAGPGPFASSTLLREYLPITSGGEVR